MRLLIRPEPYPDESLESYLLRLSQENGFERYALLSGAIRDSLLVQDHEASGAFPLELARVNVFHANRSSGLRVREGANKRGNSSRLTQSFHFFLFEPFFLP